MKLAFKKVYAFRPGFMIPIEGQKNIHKFYKVSGFLFPLLRSIFPKFVSTLTELGLAMINCVTKGYEKPVLEVRDIVMLSKR